MFHPLEDGSTALFYEKNKIQDDYKEMADYILKNLHGMTFPGWEPERMAKLDQLFEAYKPVTKEKLWESTLVRLSFQLFQHIPAAPQIHDSHGAVIKPITWPARLSPDVTSMVWAHITCISAVMIRFHDFKNARIAITIPMGGLGKIAV